MFSMIANTTLVMSCTYAMSPEPQANSTSSSVVILLIFTCQPASGKGTDWR